MPRFYVSTELSPQQTLSLPDSVVRHLQVLRLKNSDEIVLFNGNGYSYPAQLLSLEKRSATVQITEQRPSENESPLNITLIQAVSSGERMDFTLQKSVELGVNLIQPVISERCVVRLNGERAEKRVARWQEIVISACEQSGRNILPTVLPIISFTEAIQSTAKSDLKLLMSLNHAQSLANISSAPQRVTFMIGPEGGWSTQEENQAFAAGFQSITLGKRVLRTETASLAAIAAMQTLWGDFI